MSFRSPSKAVLVTGCSSGIGRATAQRLAADGWKVYATARRPDTIADLRERGCETLALDVLDEDSMQRAVEAVREAEGAVGVLVNNAGYSQSGAVESVPLDARAPPVRDKRLRTDPDDPAGAPGMRAQHWGKIVNLGSVGGKLTFPGGGIYHATKYSIEAISDALRFEVRGFGVDVILVEPGLITTQFGQTAAASVGQIGDSGPYAKFNRDVAKLTEGAYRGPLRFLGGGPEVVADTIAGALKADRPKPRYAVTPSAHITINQRRLSPDRLWDLIMRTQFPTPQE